MNLWQNDIQTEALFKALAALRSTSGAAIPIVGGIDLMLDLQLDRHKPALAAAAEHCQLQPYYPACTDPVRHPVSENVKDAHEKVLSK